MVGINAKDMYAETYELPLAVLAWDICDDVADAVCGGAMTHETLNAFVEEWIEDHPESAGYQGVLKGIAWAAFLKEGGK